MEFLGFFRRAVRRDGRDSEITEILSSMELFAGLDEKQLRMLSRDFIWKEYPKDEILIRKGDTGLGIFVIVSGSVEVYDEDDGEEVLIANVGRGECVGEMTLIDAQPRSASVRVVEPVKCLLLTRDSFNGLVRRRPQIMWGIVPILVSRLRESTERLADDDAKTLVREKKPAEVGEKKPAASPVPQSVPVAEATESEGREVGHSEEEVSEVFSEVEEESSSLFASCFQFSSATFMLLSSTWLLGSQEFFRLALCRGRLAKNLGDSEAVLSSMTAAAEKNMKDGTSKVFDSLRELLNAFVSLFET